MTDKLILKKVENKDLSVIKDILEKNDLVYEDIENKNIELFLAYKNGLFVGIIGLEQYDNIGLLRSLVVLEEYRDKGYGKEICSGLLNYAKDKKIKEVYLLTTTAKNFFEKINFKVIERKDVPDEIKNTTEFSRFCPDSAICMKMDL